MAPISTLLVCLFRVHGLAASSQTKADKGHGDVDDCQTLGRGGPYIPSKGHKRADNGDEAVAHIPWHEEAGKERAEELHGDHLCADGCGLPQRRPKLGFESRQKDTERVQGPKSEEVTLVSQKKLLERCSRLFVIRCVPSFFLFAAFLVCSRFLVLLLHLVR